MQVSKNVSACAGRPNAIRSLEHVQVRLSLAHTRRGDLEIELLSPMGTRSTLVAIRWAGAPEGGPRLRPRLAPVTCTVSRRPFDVSTQGYNDWVFMSTHFWDEDPHGVWTLGLENKGFYFNTGESRARGPPQPCPCLAPARHPRVYTGLCLLGRIRGPRQPPTRDKHVSSPAHSRCHATGKAHVLAHSRPLV